MTRNNIKLNNYKGKIDDDGRIKNVYEFSVENEKGMLAKNASLIK